ncbi:TrkH family potassium uptake protein [Lactiplantibacillus mudanjiangensis]|uniref:Potassium uptake protein TrkH [Lactobacillus zymae] n=1 Tax=Lactiplantibacillus mudanjiangensis TaxID=1296538 RepID=A0A660E7R6_9LACO|nr:potassium transporter TrkG [Lactiplantibacillus mudanjiangensis]VDG20755.1 Potassium uptake protein TrkH [Lactobacillus zymae] [Lactiplantibacillus mudanjiangensis]VDG24447.1 Potassium uptake protein TrkH [Lactobacillus zymae] [Lactiplantibacillus mudanjiangensis]VDG30080.1 Potassium uptake protein TrkH [Lactobacillus zymae] [Lactiplantibacillus mudanjiangensis]VDG30567.1 Potassium uptake protein TrkH [Lactobacillus zymae] [Lactiplantibacillus mudanjiangensis]
MERFRNFKILNTLPQKMVAGFVVLIVLGTLLLSLPLATAAGRTTSFIDVVFTAASATCITGLTVVNTASHWSVFGQLVILGLAEVGALGYMTFAVLLFNIMRRNIGLSTQLMVKESLNLENLSDTKSVMRYVVGLSLLFQVGGLVLLAVDFIPRFGWRRGLYVSLYHSVMSFCNAGFDVFGNSLLNFRGDSYVLIVTMILIIAGGLGFLVWRDLLLYHERKRLSLNSKLTLVTTISLFVIGFVLFLVTERNLHALPASWFNRTVNTLFLSVTPRTAGLITVPTTSLQAGSIFLMMILMFVGGTPGSTAGGIKTTTFGILMFQSIAQLRGKRDVEFSHRRFSQANISRALLLIFLASIVITVATLILTQTEHIPKEFGLEYIVFEVLSAFGTVGLSLGLTPHLTVIGKLVIMLLMFIGRVGIFTSLYSLSKRQPKVNSIRYPEENILIG